MTNWIIVVAGGKSSRMNLSYNKIFAKLGKLPVIYWTLLALEVSKTVDKVVISASAADIAKIKKLVSSHSFDKVVDIIPASETRQTSTLDVLETIDIEVGDLVGIHNGVNPFVSEAEIKEVFGSAKKYGAALLAQKARDTVKITNRDGMVTNTPLRQYVWYAQTPQVAKFENLLKAHRKAKKDGFVGTDDAQLLERIGVAPVIMETSNWNFKITFAEDLVIAKYILAKWKKNRIKI